MVPRYGAVDTPSTKGHHYRVYRLKRVAKIEDKLVKLLYKLLSWAKVPEVDQKRCLVCIRCYIPLTKELGYPFREERGTGSTVQTG